MQIIAPASTLQEVELLLISGVSLLLIDCLEERPFRGAQTIGTGMRQGKRPITTQEEVRRIAECAHKYDAKVYLCADAEACSAKDIQAVIDMIRAACDAMEIDGLMTGNPCLVVGLREEKVPSDVMVGPEELVLNRQAVLFWQELGVKRIVLPSYLTIDDVEVLVRDTEGIDFCAAVFRGYVSPADLPPNLAAPACHKPRLPAEASIEALFCSLCNIGRLSRAGIASVAIELHGEPCHAKVGLVTAVRTLVGMVEEGAGDEEVSRAAKEIMECEILHRSGYLCLASGFREPETRPLRVPF